MKSLFLMPLLCLFKWFLAKFLFKELKSSGFVMCWQLLSLVHFDLPFWENSEMFVYLIAISLWRTSSGWTVGWLSVIVNVIKTCHSELSCPVCLNRGSVINPDISETQINEKNKIKWEWKSSCVSSRPFSYIYVKDWSNKCHSKES